MGRPSARGIRVTLHRFFVDPETMAADRFALPAAIERQVRAVLRLRDGDRLVLLPGDGTEALCRLDAGECVVEERRAAAGEPRHRLTVVQALLKGDALEQVVQHAHRGRGRRVPAGRHRAMHRARPAASAPRTAAHDRARGGRAVGARRRAGDRRARCHLPMVLASGSVLLFERHDGQRLGQLEPPPTTVVIGPEGGFTPGRGPGRATRLRASDRGSCGRRPSRPRPRR